MSHERILIAEDDAELVGLMREYLTQEGFAVSVARDGETAWRLVRDTRPDLVVVDWMLPRLSGLDLARRLRAQSSTPIIMVTARSEESDIVVGLELGADDYVTKPVSLRQLTARIRAVLRRGRSDPDDVVMVGDLRVDFLGQTVHVRGEKAALTTTEFKLLGVLVRHPDRVFTRLQLMEAALGDYYEGYERTIDSHVSHLRRKLGMGVRIETVHGAGYKLVGRP